jgi:uncharacterized membrane protein
MSLSDNIVKQLEGTLNNYVSALVANIEKRFPDKDSSEFSEYGNTSLAMIYHHFYDNDDVTSLDECKVEFTKISSAAKESPICRESQSRWSHCD